jgi:hypothetical protein
MSTLIQLNQLKNGESQVIGASITKQAITRNFAVSARDSVCMTVDVVSSGVTVTNAINVILQSSFDGGTTWIDAKSVSVANAATLTSIVLQENISALQTGVPLRAIGRVVITTGVSDAATISAVHVSRRTDK